MWLDPYFFTDKDDRISSTPARGLYMLQKNLVLPMAEELTRDIPSSMIQINPAQINGMNRVLIVTVLRNRKIECKNSLCMSERLAYQRGCQSWGKQLPWRQTIVYSLHRIIVLREQLHWVYNYYKDNGPHYSLSLLIKIDQWNLINNLNVWIAL